MNELNKTRRELVDNHFGEIVGEMAEKHPSVVVLYRELAPKGIAGILASKCVEYFGVPSIVLVPSGTKGVAVGSGRSVPGFDLEAELRNLQDLFERFGGHAQPVISRDVYARRKQPVFLAEVFAGQDWEVRDKLALLDKMNAIQQMMIVGIYSADRMTEYTKSGYEPYGRSIVEEVKPYIDTHFHTRSGPKTIGVMGSSLGVVVSFYMGWQLERVLQEERRDVRFYLDSGWPGTTMRFDWPWQWLWLSGAIVIEMVFVSERTREAARVPKYLGPLWTRFHVLRFSQRAALGNGFGGSLCCAVSVFSRPTGRGVPLEGRFEQWREIIDCRW